MKKFIQRKLKSVKFENKEKLPQFMLCALQNRGVTDDKQLSLSLKNLEHFDSLKNIKVATEAVIESLQNQEKILIVGDYDADGVTSTALAYSCLLEIGSILLKDKFDSSKIAFFIPNRKKHGYGLSENIIGEIIKHKPKLILTVDCGIRSAKEIAILATFGIKTIITDHHDPDYDMPNCLAVINPKQKNCEFSSKNLAGVGVIFYLMLAIRSCLNLKQEIKIEKYLDLVAIGTLADLVSLDYNNRILVQNGLKIIRKNHNRLAFEELIKSIQKKSQIISCEDLSFNLIPMINSAGRMDDMNIVVNLLVSIDRKKVKTLLPTLYKLNQERRETQNKNFEEAKNLINSKENKLFHCIIGKEWNEGVIGIIASKIKDYTKTSTIIFTEVGDGKYLKGSGRAVENINLNDILTKINTENPDLIIKYGGHSQAAGLTIEKNKFEEFKKTILKNVESYKQQSSYDVSAGEINYYDCSIGEELTIENIAKLILLTPWGMKFNLPIFYDSFEIVEKNLIANKHLKFNLFKNRQYFSAIIFFVDQKTKDFFSTKRKKDIVKLYYKPKYLDINHVELNILSFDC